MKEKNINQIVAYIDNKYYTNSILSYNNNRYLCYLEYSNLDQYGITSLLKQYNYMKKAIREVIEKEDVYNEIIIYLRSFDLLYRFKLILKIYFEFGLMNEIKIYDRIYIYIR